MKSHLQKRLITAFLSTALLSTTTSFGWADMSQEEIRDGYKVNAALAQFHRWYLYYERSEGGVENAVDILTNDIRVKSSFGESIGHEEYRARTAQLPSTWKNAHFPKTTNVTVNADGTMSLSAHITYLNEGLNPEGKVRKADLSYMMELTPSDDILPKFNSIEISQNSEGNADTFIDAYAANRMLSLVHYWMALIEDPARNPEPVKEIFADGFSLNFSSGVITDFEGFKAWLAGPGSQVNASTHVISNFSTEEIDSGLFTVKMDFDWEGILPNGTELIAKTRHSWTATNDVKERFARIKTVDVEVLEPFRPKET